MQAVPPEMPAPLEAPVEAAAPPLAVVVDEPVAPLAPVEGAARAVVEGIAEPAPQEEENLVEKVRILEEEINRQRSKRGSLSASLERSERVTRLLLEKSTLEDKASAGSQRAGWGVAVLIVGTLLAFLLASDAIWSVSDSQGLCWTFIILLWVVGISLAFSKPNLKMEIFQIEDELKRLGGSNRSLFEVDGQGRQRRELEWLNNDLEAKGKELLALKARLETKIPPPAAVPATASPGPVLVSLPDQAGSAPAPGGERQGLEARILSLKHSLAEWTGELAQADKAYEMQSRRSDLERQVNSSSTRKGWGWFILCLDFLLIILLAGDTFNLETSAGFCWAGVIVMAIVGLGLAFSNSNARQELEELDRQFVKTGMPSDGVQLSAKRTRLNKAIENARGEIVQVEQQLSTLATSSGQRTGTLAASLESGSAQKVGMPDPQPAAPQTPPAQAVEDTQAGLGSLLAEQKVILQKMSQVESALELVGKLEELERKATVNAARKGWGWFLFGGCILFGILLTTDIFNTGDYSEICWLGVVVIGFVGFLLGVTSSTSRVEIEVVENRLGRLALGSDRGELNQLKTYLHQQELNLREKIRLLQKQDS